MVKSAALMSMPEFLLCTERRQKAIESALNNAPVAKQQVQKKRDENQQKRTRC
jgi:hypothetical protein